MNDDDKTGLVINKFVSDLLSIFPAFKIAFPPGEELENFKLNLLLALKDEGITSSGKLKFCLRKCRQQTNPFAPSIGQLVAWCKPTSDDLGLMSAPRAYRIAYEIMRGGETTGLEKEQLDIIMHTIHESGSHFLKNNPQLVTEKVFYRNYDIAVSDYLQGKLKPIPKALEAYAQENPKNGNSGRIIPEYENIKSFNAAKSSIAELLRHN